MRPLPLLVLLLAATGLILKAPGVGEAHRFELMLGVLAAGGVLGILRGLDLPLFGLLWDEYGERRAWPTLLGVATILVCLGLANWHAENGAELERGQEARVSSVDLP